MKFYYCKHCGNVIAYAKSSGVDVICCNEKMTELIPNTVDASKEKHIPVVEQVGYLVKVTIGSIIHPMIETHFIEWICLETNFGNQRKLLKPGDNPTCEFALLEGEKVIAAYCYCNLHGLWKVMC